MDSEKIYNILNNFTTKNEAYNYFNITPNSKGILKLKEIANIANFNLDIYKDRRKPAKKYCLYCNNILIIKNKKFCNRSCSASYTNKNRKISDDTKIKISNTLKSKFPKTIKKCKICGQEKCLNKDICKHTKKWFNNLIPFDFNINTLGTIKIYQEYFRIKELLIKEYYDNLLSPKDIIKKYNCLYTGENLLHILRQYKIITRNISDSVKNAILQGKLNNQIGINNNYQYKHGWFYTWNNKNVYYRSSYELDYIIELDSKKIDFDVEYFRLKYWDSQMCKYRIAIPDIFIRTENLIIEIKSIFTLDKQNMVDKIIEYKKLGYTVKILLEHKMYDDNFNLIMET